MKIGILTHPLCTNYGGILQNFALQQTLRSLGHEPITIERTLKLSPLPLWRIPLATMKRLLLHSILHKKNSLAPFREERYNKALPVVTQYTRTFVGEHIATRLVRSFSDIAPADFDAFIVGSDQVWRPYSIYEALPAMFLTFSEGWNVKRVAYAASLGTDEWEFSPEQTEQYKPYLKQFNAVSVREDSAIALIASHFEVDATHVLDPTMLLHMDDYAKLAEQKPASNGTLLVHILDTNEQKCTIVDRICSDYGLIPFTVAQKHSELNLSAPISQRIQPPVEQWLRGFMDAKMIFTDSFHACVFSILFNKPFIAFCNLERGASRFQSLLGMFGLKQLLVYNESDYSPTLLQGIDYTAINKKMEDLRDFSMSFLTNALT